jgi:hypothetical protein
MGQDARIAARRRRLVAEFGERRKALAAQASDPGEHISPHYLSAVIGDVLADATIFNEYPLIHALGPPKRLVMVPVLHRE